MCHCQALQSLVASRHVALATSTSSGKSLVYNSYTLHAIAQSAGQGKALFLFPTKSLAQVCGRMRFFLKFGVCRDYRGALLRSRTNIVPCHVSCPTEVRQLPSQPAPLLMGIRPCLNDLMSFGERQLFSPTRICCTSRCFPNMPDMLTCFPISRSKYIQSISVSFRDSLYIHIKYLFYLFFVFFLVISPLFRI